jgi:phosphoribosyl 1,2-cyclic phosphate phosphodiesterase
MPYVSAVFTLGVGSSSGQPLVKCFNTATWTFPSGPCERCMQSLLSGQHLSNPTTLIELRNGDGDDSSTPPRRILVDAGKTFRATILNWFVPNSVRRVDEVIVTHSHADAYSSVATDLVPLLAPGGKTPLHTDAETHATLDRVFGADHVSSLYARNVLEPWKMFTTASGIDIMPLHVLHGAGVHCLGFLVSLARDGRLREGADVLVFLSDIGDMETDVRDRILALKYRHRVLILDMLQHQSYVSHFSYEQAIAEAQRLDAFETFFIGVSHGIDKAAAMEDFARRKLNYRFCEEGKPVYQA